MIKSVHVVPNIDAEAGGPSYSVPMLCRSLAEQGERVELHVLAQTATRNDSNPPFIHEHQAWPIPKRFGISTAMLRALQEAAAKADVIHNHSLWMFPNICPVIAIRRTHCRLVTSPRGTLSAWALRRSRWLKKLVWVCGQSEVLKKSSCIHATAEAECHDIRQLGLKPPIAVIPNGIEIPFQIKQEKDSNQLRKILFLSRIHPKKGVDVLLRAWANLEKHYAEWELEIVGPGDPPGYLQQMKALAKDLHIRRVSFPGPAYGRAKTLAYSSADLFVLPTHSENFGVAVAEALAHALPVVVTKGAPWAGLMTHRCGWWIDSGVGALTGCLREALSLSPVERTEWGARGRTWMQSDFSWERIGAMMHKTYLWLSGGGTPPDWVRNDG